MSSDSIIIIPTYNEVENIEPLINAVLQLSKPFHILVVDDNSPDLTALKVKELQETFPGQIFLEKRMKKEGLGTAYIHGFKWALKKDYDFIFEMDADFSHNPKDLLRLYDACYNNTADVAIGSRYVKGVNVVNWPLSRILLSYGASLYVRLLTGMPLRDPTAGFICYRKNVIQHIGMDQIQFVGYAFQIEMKFRAFLKKFNITEVPIVFTDRVRGASKMSGKIINEAVFGVVSMKFKSLFQKDKFWGT